VGGARPARRSTLSGALVIALLGAESTGKTTLSLQLAEALREQTGLRCAVVDEHLRTWCERMQRTPQGHEQREIALEQHRRIEAAAQTQDVVIADTTAVQTAAYSHLVWGDDGLDAWAAALHAQTVQATLLTAIDLPWVADGLQRDGPHVQGPVDARLRALLASRGIAWSLVTGSGVARLDHALLAVSPMLQAHAGSRLSPRAGLFSRLAERQAQWPAWQTACKDCDDPQCEHRLFRPSRPSA
jgi:nicotinamide riboside kinase